MTRSARDPRTFYQLLGETSSEEVYVTRRVVEGRKLVPVFFGDVAGGLVPRAGLFQANSLLMTMMIRLLFKLFFFKIILIQYRY